LRIVFRQWLFADVENPRRVLDAGAAGDEPEQAQPVQRPFVQFDVERANQIVDDVGGGERAGADMIRGRAKLWRDRPETADLPLALFANEIEDQPEFVAIVVAAERASQHRVAGLRDVVLAKPRREIDDRTGLEAAAQTVLLLAETTPVTREEGEIFRWNHRSSIGAEVNIDDVAGRRPILSDRAIDDVLRR